MSVAVRDPRILGADGQPVATSIDARAEQRRFAKFLGSAVDTYLRALGVARAPAEIRARDPFSNHPWVFAWAMTAAIVASHAPYTVFRETPEEGERRRMAAKRAGRAGHPRAGYSRRAVHRHLLPPVARRLLRKAAEPDLEHPVMDVLLRPNPQQDAQQFVSLLVIWMMIRGEAFVVKTDEMGNQTATSPARLWPFGPDCFHPLMSRDHPGEQVGWEFTPPDWASGGRGRVRMQLAMNEVIQLKFPNPNDPRRGMSRLSAAAHGISVDLMIKSHNWALIRNEAVPRTVLTTDQQLSPTQMKDFMDVWEQQHEGEESVGGTELLPFGFKLEPISIAPKDMEYLAQQNLNRQEILGVMSTPPSVLGLTDSANWSTALVWDRGYWEKTILPILRLIEVAFDDGLFFDETDNVFGMFDLTGVEALRAGVGEKIDQADKLCQSRLHVPPRVAFQVVGLEVPEYEGDEVAFAGALDTPVEQVLADPIEETPPAPAAPEPQGPDSENEETPAEEESVKRRGPGLIFRDSRRTRIVKAGNRWKQFIKLEGALERKMRGRYRQWVREQRDEVLTRFDRLTKARKDLDFSAFLPDPIDAASKLKGLVRPLYAAGLDATYNFTLEELGVATFEIDDDRLIDFFTKRETKFTTTTPATIRRKLTKSLTEGVKASETIQELRARVAQVYEVSAGSWKTLTVARTETAGFINGERDQMFQAQGMEAGEWFTAGDEHVRPAHVAFGEAGPKPFGFNWLEVTGESGTLRHPGDSDAPAKHSINCRCLILAAS